MGGMKYAFDPPPLCPRTFVKLTEDFYEKSPPYATKFWGPFFQKFGGFWEKLQKMNDF